MSKKYTSAEQQASYGIGLQMGEQLTNNPFEGIDAEAVAAGVIDALEGNEFSVSHEELDKAFAVINEKMQASQQDQAGELAAEGQAFLEENAKRDEVNTTSSGLQYEILVNGDGEKPKLNSTVKTHYHGTLIDGTIFDSSVDRGQAAEFPVNGVISGWTEALQIMPTGSKWRLYIPHELAYGERGAGGAIKPYSALIFDIELLDIVA